MTQPTPPGGNLPPPMSPSTGTPNLGGLLGGASGSLGGTNILQASLDRLTNAVTGLGSRLGNLGGTLGNGGGNNNGGQNGGGTFGGFARFPRPVNPFRLNQTQQGGIGGAGGPNTGNANITPTPTFGQMAYNQSGASMMVGAVASFGQNIMQNQLALNQYATTSMLGMNRGGAGFNQSMQQLYRQVGATPSSLNALAMSPQDAYAMASPLQQLGGTQLINQSSLGRAGLGAAAGFGMSNPTLGAQTSAQLAAALYSPSFSLNMMKMGYNPIRSMTGGAPMNAGQAAQSILQGMGLNGMSPSRTFGNLASPKGQIGLQALFGSSGVPNQQAQQFLQTYQQLFSKGLNPTQASNLIQSATFGSTSSTKAAQARLSNLGVATSANDIQALKNAQAVTTGRQGEYAGGFNDAIQQSTSLLEDFNNSLNKLLQGPLGTAAGYAGGTAGVLSGTAHGAGLGLGLGGALSLSRVLGMGASGAGGAGSVFGAGAGVGSAIAPMLAAAVPMVAGLLIGAAAKAIGDKLTPAGTTLGAANQQGQKMSAGTGMTAFSGLFAKGISAVAGALHIGALGGGAASAAQSQQTKNNNTKQTGGSISGAAKSAVGAAETQLGVPYVYGDEIPGVGFDCSGLVQWAYKQAGVSLPRTSQAMWSALKSRRVPLNAVQEGDLIFTGGSDGTSASPGHVAMMINSHELIQAPYTGRDVERTGYDPRAWTGAVRPSGRGSFVSGGPGGGMQTTGNSSGSSLFAGNRGLGMGSGGGGNYGSANEVDIINAMGAGGGGMGGSFIGNSGGSNGTSGTSNKNAGAGGGSAATPRNKAGIVAMAQKLARQYGWASGIQWNDFLKVVNHEDASWDVHATNPNGGAYGIPQALPGSKMASAGPDWKDNPETQLKWMFGYIKGKYGTPAGAWSHEQALGWYGAGGTLAPGMSIVGERGPELAINSGGQTHIFSNAQTNYLLNAIKGNVSQSPWSTGSSSGSMSSSHAAAINVNFGSGSIVINGNNNSHSIASKAGREIARSIIKHVNSEAMHQAVRNGDKL